MNTSFKSLIAAACIMLAGSGVAFAEHKIHDPASDNCGKGHHSKHHPANLHRFGHPQFLQGIALSAEQEDKLFALHHAQMPKVREQMKQRHALHQQLNKLSQAPQFDELTAKSLAEQLALLEKEHAIHRAKTAHQVLSLLTPDQREQALKNIEKFNNHRSEHHPIKFHGQLTPHRDIKS